MPHSPRWYRDQAWLLNSDTGFLGTLDPGSGRFDDVPFCPGYLHGISFAGDFVVVGLSSLRKNRTFAGLPLDDNLSPRCGLQVIHLKTGDTVYWLRIKGIVQKLCDVIVLPGARRPQVLGFKTDEIHRMLSVGEMQSL